VPKTTSKPKPTKPRPKAKQPKVVQTEVASAVARSQSGNRVLQTPKFVWHKPLTWRNRAPVPEYARLPKARLLLWQVLKQLWEHKKLFGGITLLYGVLNIMLVRGLADGSNLSNYKATLDVLLNGQGGKLTSSTASFIYLLGTAGGGGASTAGVYQAILILTCSLAFIWAFRQTLAGRTVSVRDSFYRGMYPLVPFLLVFLLMGLQLVPLALGRSFYSTMVGGGIAYYLWERAIVLFVFLALALWSISMMTASAFALYIVTLPDMTPLRAYRSARKLVYGRRLLLWRKIIFLPALLFVLAAVIELPLIFFLTPVAAWTFFLFGMVALPLVNGYMYLLYREML